MVFCADALQSQTNKIQFTDLLENEIALRQRV